ncbi:MAG: hypothetical protein GX093_12195 [Xanthomonadaceae bacterium]|nr:hypothetical protein [Xanthomonadaceae bacterium]
MMLSRLDEEQLDDMELMDTGVVGPNLIVLCREKAEGSCDELAVLLERFPESSHGRRFFADLQAEGWTAAPELSYYDSLLPRLRARMPEL